MERGYYAEARSRVFGPAVGLIVVCGISIVALVLALAFDAWLIASAADRMRQPQTVSKESQILMRGAWSVLILISNVVILAGAISLLRLRSAGFARTACVLALIPCLGPCFILGVPFGIWGLVAMNDRRVRAAFDDEPDDERDDDWQLER